MPDTRKQHHIQKGDIIAIALERSVNINRLDLYIGRDPTQQRLLWALAYVLLDYEQREIIDKEATRIATEIKSQFGVNAAFELIVLTNKWLAMYDITLPQIRVGLARYRDMLSKMGIT